MDEADHAKDLEMADRQRALDAQMARAHETEMPRERHGVRVCLNCHEPIDPARLKARPESVRCIWCQHLREHWQR